MILGQSAGMAAGIAIEDGVEVQKVDYGKLKRQCLRLGNVCSPYGVITTFRRVKSW